MDKLFKPMVKAKLIEGIEHQGIGGQEILIEREVDFDLILNHGTFAAYNFIGRRDDLILKENKLRFFYGHVGTLGYFIASDEIEEVLEGDLDADGI